MDALRWTKKWASEEGAELVEFAISFPLLLLICLGIIDFGFLFQQYEVLTNAAREGARIAVLPGYGDADVQARVSQYLVGTGLAPGSVTTSLGAPQAVALAGGACITVVPVTVSFDHEHVFLAGIGQLFGSDFGTTTLTATASMRHETAAVACPAG